MQNSLRDRDWSFLLRRIEDGACTPVLGPGVWGDLAPSGREIAQGWAHEYGYPLVGSDDLPRVAQYLAIQEYELFPKDRLQGQLKEIPLPDFGRPDQPHSILADLQLPIYITTSYFDYMFRALKSRMKEPIWELCRWNRLLLDHPSNLGPDYEPRPATPLVYHLFGHYNHPESLVLTEDDYIDFLVNVSSDEFPLPARIKQTLTDSSLLFIGFNPFDWDFRVLFRGLINRVSPELRRISVTVQVPPMPGDTPEQVVERMERYFSSYFHKIDAQMRIYWGTAEEFLLTLWQRQQGQLAGETAGEKETGPQINKARLFRNLKSYFSKDEILDLAFELDVDADDLPPAKNSFARELILYLDNRQRLPELLAICRQERPNIAW